MVAQAGRYKTDMTRFLRDMIAMDGHVDTANAKTWKEPLVKCAAMYAAAPLAYPPELGE